MADGAADLGRATSCSRSRRRSRRIRRPEGGLSAQIGRQRFEDERQWLYDEDLDAVRLRSRARASRSSSASRDEPRPEGRARPEPTRAGQQLRALRELQPAGLAGARGLRDRPDDRRAERRRPVFVGLRLRGEPVEDLDYWLELAYVGGREGSKNIRGGPSRSAPPTRSRSVPGPRSRSASPSAAVTGTRTTRSTGASVRPGSRRTRGTSAGRRASSTTGRRSIPSSATSPSSR